MRTSEGFETTLRGILITTVMPKWIGPEEHNQMNEAVENIMTLFADELTRCAWQNIRKKYRNKNKNNTP